jgi:hypothetical protein
MPTFLPPEAARFDLRDGVPVITLAVDVPVDLSAAAWSVLNRVTLFLVDGPGDAGFMLPRIGPAGDIAPLGWDDAVNLAAGSHIVFGTSADAPTVFARSVE